jgi:DNA-directed RNA polymerase subunit RPC12/RpoP
MGLEPLLEGKCAVRKNRSPHQVFTGSLVFDDDLRKYKIFADGAIAYAFGPLQIKNTDYDISGTIRKRSSMGIYVNFPDGNEYLFDFGYRDDEQLTSAETQIKKIRHDEEAREEMLTLLKSRERVTIEEISSLLKKRGSEVDMEHARRFVDSAIATGRVQGTFNGTEFVNKSSASDMSVRYDVAVKLELASSGALALKCPSCGSILSLEKKESNVKCNYCGQSCFVPRKVLDMI